MLHAAAFASVLAMAQPQADAAAPPLVAVQPAEGVIAYDAAFFAAGAPANAMEMIQRVPGFAFDGGDSVRGFEGAAGNVLIDGKRPITKTDDLEEVLRRVPASAVERIELIRGGAPGIDMQGKAVLANVVRKPGGGFRGLAALANNHVYDGRDALGVRLEASGGDGVRSWELGVRGGAGIDDGAGEGPRVRIDASGAPLILSAIDSEGNGDFWTATGAYETPALGGVLRVNGRLYQDLYDYDEVSLVSFPDVRTERSHDGTDERELELGLRYSRPLGSKTSLEVIGLHQAGELIIGASFAKPGYDEVFDLDRNTTESILRSVVSYRRSPTLSFELGAEGALNKLESHTAYSQLGAPVAVPAANVEVEEQRGEVFAKAVWRPTPKWTVEGGLRGEGSAVSSEGDVRLEKTLYFAKPRLALTWAPREGTQLRGRIERTVGQLDFDDFVAESSLNTGVVTAGNPDLEPEKAWVAEAAIEQRFWGQGAIVATLRHSELTDVVDRAPVFGGPKIYDAPANIGEGTKDELILNLTLPFDRLGLKGAQLQAEGTWRRSEVTDPTTGEGREISDLEPVEWEAHFTHDLPQWRATWGIDAYGAYRETSYRFDEVSTFKLKTFVRPFVEWKPKDDLSIRVELPNVTERGLRRTRTVYAGPRGSSAIAYVDDRDIQFGRMFYIRVRKTFGA
jgi:outer membrane receptor protein involved in Fe transport